MNNNIDQVLLNLEKKLTAEVEQKITKAVTNLYWEIVDRTPVDTGALHKAWEINWGNGFIKPAGRYADKLKFKSGCG